VPIGKEDLLTELYDSYAVTEMLLSVAAGRPPVRGSGPLDAPLVVVGEAPGEKEEKDGEPFVGASGQKLQALFAKVGIPWGMCYRTNVLPWRPPRNRTPYPFEIDESMYRVQAEIRIIRPLVVVASGAVAWQAVTSRYRGIFAANRGKWLRWSPDGYDFACDLLAIYHPAALLHAPAYQRDNMEAATIAALQTVLEGDRVPA
jgi:uracil-DNA glycosylase family 4